MKKKISLMIAVLMLSLLLLTGCGYSFSAPREIQQYVSRTASPYDSSMPYYGGWDEYYDGFDFDSDFSYDDDDYYYDYDYDYDYGYDYENDYGYDYFFGASTSPTFGYAVIVVFGYVVPLALIVLSLVFYLKSNSNRRYAWFIMTGTGLVIALLSTLYMLLTM